MRPESIFVSSIGEWRLGGFEAVSNPKDEASPLYVSHLRFHAITNNSIVEYGGLRARCTDIDAT